MFNEALTFAPWYIMGCEARSYQLTAKWYQMWSFPHMYMYIYIYIYVCRSSHVQRGPYVCFLINHGVWGSFLPAYCHMISHVVIPTSVYMYMCRSSYVQRGPHVCPLIHHGVWGEFLPAYCQMISHVVIPTYVHIYIDPLMFNEALTFAPWYIMGCEASSYQLPAKLYHMWWFPHMYFYVYIYIYICRSTHVQRGPHTSWGVRLVPTSLLQSDITCGHSHICIYIYI